MERQKMKDEAAVLIVEAVKFAAYAAVNASDCGIPLSASLYLNIRDAMFHYKALCDCEEGADEDALKHYFNLKEHLTRGEKDAVIFQARTVVDATFEVLQQKENSKGFSSKEIRQLQSFVHEMKNVILDVRTQGTDLSIGAEFSVYQAWNKVVNYTIEIAQIFKDRNVLLF